MKSTAMRMLVVMLSVATSGIAAAAPIDYTVRTVASGRLGSVAFTNARVTMRFHGDTSNVRSEAVNGGNIYSNHSGFASIEVRQLNGQVIRATLRRGQVYVRYDSRLGLLGFAAVGGAAGYPLLVGCFDPFVCSDIGSTDGYTFFAHYDGLATMLADIAAFPADASSVTNDTLTLPTDLSSETLLTGYAHSCAVPLVNQTECPTGSTRPLHTDRGDLYLSDMYPNTAIFTAAFSAE